MNTDPSVSTSLPGPQSTTEFVERIKRIGVNGLMAEFNAIKSESLAGPTAAFEQNVARNRYGNIPLLDETRVVLNDDLPQQYIHASYLDGYNRQKAYIISQAPVPAAIVDYWRMVWQERISVIVCLTSLKERGGPKADIFFPPEISRPFRAGPFRIFAESINPVAAQHRTMLIHLRLRCWFARKGTQDRPVVMILYGNWPDTAVSSVFFSRKWRLVESPWINSTRRNKSTS